MKLVKKRLHSIEMDTKQCMNPNKHLSKQKLQNFSKITITNCKNACIHIILVHIFNGKYMEKCKMNQNNMDAYIYTISNCDF